MTIVTVHSAITGQPVPGATLDTSKTTFGAALQLALSYPEVQRADMSDRLAAQDALESLFTGGYPYRGVIHDYRFNKYGISHITVEDAPAAQPATVEPAPEQDSAQDTPIYASLSAPVQSAPSTFHSVKSTPADFKQGINWQAVLVPVAAFVAGVVAGGVIF